MRRITILLGIACLVAAGTWGMWRASRSLIPLGLSPDATEIAIGAAWWETTLSYRPERRLNDWYVPVVQQLEAGGWTRRDLGYAGRPWPLVDPIAYERRTAHGVVVLQERVELHGDLHGAQVRMRRAVRLARP